MPRKKKPVKLFTLDTETIGLDGALRRIAIYDGSTVQYGYTFGDIEPYLSEYADEYQVHVYIHNLEFDARKCPEIFRKGNVRWNNCLVINNKYASIACKDYVLHDSGQLIPGSLEKLSKDFDLEHGKLDLWDEVQKIYPGMYDNKVDFLARCHVDDELYLRYLGYDVISLYELILKLIEVSTIPLESLVKCPTTASMSKWIFKNGYGGKPFITEGREKTDFEILTQNKYWLSDKPMKECPEVSYKEVEYKIRESYSGGRTEVFTPLVLPKSINGINAYHYDVNSLYPYVCYDKPYPVGVPQYITSKSGMSYNWRFWLKSHHGAGFMKCKVFIPKQKIPPLPVKVGKLSFFTGYIEGTWTYPELEYAVQNCGVEIIEIYEVIYFKHTFHVYKNFMKVITDMKEKADRDGNLALRTFCKLIANSAYGWTCMSREGKTQLDYLSNYEKYKEDNRLIRVDTELEFCEAEMIVRSETIQVQVGAYVTSYARIMLLDALRKQAEKGEVYYCDTDSIVCEKPMPEEIVDNHKLGYWGLENVISTAIFLQPKVYTEITAKGTKFKFKGVTKERQKTFTFEFYQEIYQELCKGDKSEIEIESDIVKLPRLLTAQKNNKDPNVLIHTKKNMYLYNVQKRKMFYKDNRSEPWHMESIEQFKEFDFNTIMVIRGDFFEKRRRK